ncbi:hypothetical protein [Actinoplanes friuliensis]|uniref:Uncharacterized protein n=1 Tax=Actinoplanes friuliensis DSM 7358 TaxID=1246995 RepID=U5W8I9_9ACTN|nr:hypothetical protein [Actinoplanes friuliensis]AGZ44295.1 hypothetical protein AFR_30175 [Actinoplanes friuliensis DSM 7358]
MKRRVTPFGLAVVGCLILAGWALWSGGILDGPIARQVRSSSVYAAPGVGLDQAAAERVIGNRRLVVVMLEPGTEDLRQGCDAVRQAAKGTLVLVLSRQDDEFDNYGCALLPGVDDENFGKAAVAETTIASGVDGFADRPVEALKVVAVNYDGLVKAGVVPDGARTISPSLPRYLIAAAAILAVLLGSLILYLGGRRAGRLAAAAAENRQAATDARTEVGAAATVLAQGIIDLDQRYAQGRRSRKFDRQYRKLTADYTGLLTELADGAAPAALTTRIDSLTDRCRKLSATA